MTPKFWVGGRGEIAGGRRGVMDGFRKITIAYFAKKVSWKMVCFQKREKLAKNVDVNGKNLNFWG